MSSTNQGKHDRWLIFQNDQLLFIYHDTSLQLPSTETIDDLTPYFLRHHPIGEFDNCTIFCAELQSTLPLTHSLVCVPLRNALEHLGDEWYSIATKAFTIINWDRNHQFCGRCGHATKHKDNSFERSCTHCNLHFYPRISPSVIVLIQHQDQVLMARSHHFKPGIYGLIAGFVEAGESLEEAVHREVFEETRIRVKNLRYFGSQVWPFPDSLMAGFYADYASGELNIENDEIEAAGWYRFDNLPGRPSSKISIASRMLDHCIAQHEQAHE